MAVSVPGATQMIFEQIATGGCRSYLIGCEETRAALVIDPAAQQIEHTLALASRHGLRIRYVADTHTHADHFSAAQELSRRLSIPALMHTLAPARHADFRLAHGEILRCGTLRVQALHTPGHTRDSMCLLTEGRVFTGDTLLIGGTGRTDLPTGDPTALHASLFTILAALPPDTRVHPAHEYKGRGHSTIGDEFATNPRLQKRDRAAFVEMMRDLNLAAPIHLTEALRTNMSGGKTIDQMLADAAAAVPFIAIEDLHARLAAGDPGLVLLDVREREAYEAGHIPGARHLPRGLLELRVNTDLPDPTAHILVVCDLGHISTLAAATLRELGFQHATALDGGLTAWRERGLPLTLGSAP